MRVFLFRCLRLAALCAGCGVLAGPAERIRPPAGQPATPPKALDLSMDDLDGEDERVPARVLSPIFRSYSEPLSRAKPLQDLHRKTPEEIANEQLVRSFEEQARAASDNSAVCLNRDGGNSTGGGVRWSLNDGFGFYVQGRAFKHLQRLMKRNAGNICPPGDPSPMCKTMPKQVCD
ncbi:hypothetical protein [Chitinimonas koreensis]|uniref:hypothetical protein n=1 Tax=Chitinimonas koreensis TaxID=356302 RepID=UPI00041AB9DC|nr:hypothetical protein [Chitinimonas koreensis]QNM96280.1 hypothetical protein H9L41_21170 [Chitinimonas koreensis]